MALLKCNQHRSNSWSTTIVLAFARGRAKGKLGDLVGGSYWPNPTANLIPKRRKLTCFTHIYFYYWHTSTCIGDSLFYRAYHGIIVKRRKPGRRKHWSAQINKKKAHSTILSGPTTYGTAAQGQPETHQRKAVARQAGQGPPAPPGPTFLWRFNNDM